MKKKNNLRFSVSLVYTKNESNKREIALRCMVADAVSKEEALGMAVINFSKEMEDFSLDITVAMPVEPDEQYSKENYNSH